MGVGKPLGLASVLVSGMDDFTTSQFANHAMLRKSELSASRVIVPLNTFKSALNSIYHPGSLPARVMSYLVGKPLWWALQQLDIVGENHRELEEQLWKRIQGEYVVIPLLEVGLFSYRLEC
jgi:charged multivesicular body protein 7